MSSWDGIEEFVMVAETGSFTEAARRLNVSTSHISRRVQALENRLGLKLLSRTTRTVKLTDAGSDYLARVRDLILGIEEVNQDISGASANLEGPLRISAAGPFAEKEAIPALLEFAERNPGISLDVKFNNRNVDLVEEGYDFAIRYGVLADSALVARKLATRQLVCGASPAYLEQFGEPKEPGDLRHHACLLTNTSSWRFQDPGTGKPIQIKVGGRIRTDSIQVMRSAAARGFGIAYTPIENLQDMIETGSIRQILQGFEDKSRSHWIVYPDRRLVPLRVRAAIDFLLTAFAGSRD